MLLKNTENIVVLATMVKRKRRMFTLYVRWPSCK